MIEWVFLWCNIFLAFTTNLEDSKLNPEENNSIDSSPNLNEDNKGLYDGNKKEENVKAFTEFLEKASNQDSSEEKVNIDSEQQKTKIDKSLLKSDLLILSFCCSESIFTFSSEES